MILRGGLVFILIFILSCADKMAEEQKEELAPSISNNEVISRAPEKFAVACGMLFMVEDYDTWIKSYTAKAKNLLVVLRNVNDPAMVVLFEAVQSEEAAVKRTNDMLDNTFLNNSGIKGNPVVDYYNVKYYNPPNERNKYYLALTFELENSIEWIQAIASRVNDFSLSGLTPVGIGTNSNNEHDVYILLTLDDYVGFRKANNAPRKIKSLIARLELPENTLISYWSNTTP